MVLIGGHWASIARSPDRLIFLCGKRSLGETTAVDDHLEQAARSLHQDFPEDRGKPADRQSKYGESDEIGAGHVSLRCSRTAQSQCCTAPNMALSLPLFQWDSAFGIQNISTSAMQKTQAGR